MIITFGKQSGMTGVILYRGNRINNFLDSKEKFDMKDMIDLQVDYYSIPSEQIIKNCIRINY